MKKKRGKSRRKHRKKAKPLKRAKKRIVRKAKKKAIGFALSAFFKSCYLLGLSMLIPFILVYTIPTSPEESFFRLSLGFFLAALALVLVSFYGLFWRHRKIGKTFKTLGFVSLVPGIIAAFVATWGRSALIEAVLNLKGGDISVSLLTFYIERTVPKLQVLVFGYVLIGIFFYWIGTKLGE